jgi:hypothetical protein
MLNALLEGSLSNEKTERVKAHLFECSECSSAFLKLAARGIFQAQVAFRSQTGGARWVYLTSLATAGVDWAIEEIEKIRKALTLAAGIWTNASINSSTPTRSRGPRGPATRDWPGSIDVPLHHDPDHPEPSVLCIQILRPPTLTMGGEFTASICCAELSLAGARLTCTVHCDKQTAVEFEQTFRPDDNHQLLAVMVATGLPQPRSDLILPRDCVSFRVYTR